MSQILAWKCDHDGKIFESKEKYTKHLRKLAGQRAQQRKIDQMNKDRDSFLKRMGDTVTSIKELEEFITENWDWFFANGMKHNLWMGGAKPTTKHTLVKIKFENMRWSDSVSNTHSYPRNGGVQNWAQHNPDNAHLPKGYPGWVGDICFTVHAGFSDHKVPRPYSGYGADYFKNTIINTGGGIGGTDCDYDMKLFAADFPAMAEERSKAQVWSILSDQAVIGEYA